MLRRPIEPAQAGLHQLINDIGGNPMTADPRQRFQIHTLGQPHAHQQQLVGLFRGG